MKAITHNNNTYITDLFRALKFQSKTRALKRRIISKLNVFILIFLSLPSHGIVCFKIMKYSQIYMHVKSESKERSKESGNLRNERKGNLICRLTEATEVQLVEKQILLSIQSTGYTSLTLEKSSFKVYV